MDYDQIEIDGLRTKVQEQAVLLNEVDNLRAQLERANEEVEAQQVRIDSLTRERDTLLGVRHG